MKLNCTGVFYSHNRFYTKNFHHLLKIIKVILNTIYHYQILKKWQMRTFIFPSNLICIELSKSKKKKKIANWYKFISDWEDEIYESIPVVIVQCIFVLWVLKLIRIFIISPNGWIEVNIYPAKLFSYTSVEK